MVIELNVESLVSQMKAVSHREVAEITDVEARYRAEAGSEKIADLKRCIDDAARRLYGRCARFLHGSTQAKVGDNPVKYTYDFSMSERRAINKEDALREVMTTFVLEYALSKFYSIVSQVDLSNKHSLLAIDAGNNIDVLLLTKMPPQV